MAITRGAGTEIIRAGHFEECTSTNQILIEGVQHHIYTVITVIVKCMAVATDKNFTHMYLVGYDSNGGTSGQGMGIFKQDMSIHETYVWNDKFSFNGFEPVDFTGPLSTESMQNAIADQGSSVGQSLYHVSEAAGDNFDVTITYLDQNNA